ncbi:hypothetical protein ACLMJK_000556 [Lecanora helva]
MDAWTPSLGLVRRLPLRALLALYPSFLRSLHYVRTQLTSEQCEPYDRDWEGKKQACNNCSTHSLSCSPNYKNKDDPAVGLVRQQPRKPTTPGPPSRSRSRSTGSSRPNDPEDGNVTDKFGGQDACSTQSVATPSVTSTSFAPDRRAWYSALSHQELAAKAVAKIEQLNLLGVYLVYQSYIAPINCKNAGGPQDYNDIFQSSHMTIRGRMQSLFINIHDLGSSAASQGHNELAQEIFLKLQLALERHSSLCDNRTRGVLMKMALHFQSRDDHYESERIMEKLADVRGFTSYPFQESPCSLLAESFSISSGKAHQFLTNLWQKTYGMDGITVNLAIPPLHRAAQKCNADLTAIILSSSHDHNLGSAMFGQYGLHIAASQGCVQIVDQLVKAGAVVDVRDLHDRTPLFLAALNGHEHCCLLLLAAGADPNSRDSHGHTLLERAALGGHLLVVQHLTDRGAEVNPTLAYCASTPLQAALQSPQFSQEIALHLLDHDANVNVQRLCDGQNALQLAERRGFAPLVGILRQRMLPLAPPQSTQAQPGFLSQVDVPDFDFTGYVFNEQAPLDSRSFPFQSF